MTATAAAQRSRLVVAKPGLDGHDRGAKSIARALRDAGMEVIYTGLHQTPEQIVETVLHIRSTTSTMTAAGGGAEAALSAGARGDTASGEVRSET